MRKTDSVKEESIGLFSISKDSEDVRRGRTRIMKDTTVSAVSTPYGRGGIAVIRISGNDAFSVADKMFRAKNGKKLSEMSGGRVIYGDILYGSDIIDDGLASVFRAPKSFTGEDTVEISCHGGILITSKVLESTFLCGAEPAGPGEFTMRSFMSGHIGLSQAEAVMDMIDAKSGGQLAVASAQSRGVLSGKVGEIYGRLAELVAGIYVDIDYPGEELSSYDTDKIITQAVDIISEIRRLAETYKIGHAVSEGIPVVIAGKPNTGKSSLMNMLLCRDRAIVTSEAGTTRDVIEETLEAGSVLLRLFDTAGIRSAESEAERLGIERTLGKMSEAELVLAVFDISSEPDGEDRRFISELEKYKASGGKILVILNKSDLRVDKGFDGIKDLLSDRFGAVQIVSAANGEGRKEILSRIESMYLDGSIDLKNDAVVSNSRQYAALNSAMCHLSDAIDALNGGMTEDIAGTDMELALSALGQLDGRSVTEDIVHGIFSRFCVGK